MRACVRTYAALTHVFLAMYIRMILGIPFSASTSHEHTAVQHTPMDVGCGVVILGVVLLVFLMIILMLAAIVHNHREHKKAR